MVNIHCFVATEAAAAALGWKINEVYDNKWKYKNCDEWTTQRECKTKQTNLNA